MSSNGTRPNNILSMNVDKNLPASSPKESAKKIGNAVVTAINALDKPNFQKVNCYLSQNLGMDVDANAATIEKFFEIATTTGLPTDFDNCLKVAASRRRRPRSSSRRRGRKRSSGRRRKTTRRSRSKGRRRSPSRRKRASSRRRRTSSRRSTRRRRKVDADDDM